MIFLHLIVKLQTGVPITITINHNEEKEKETKEEMTYTIKGATEANSLNGIISNESPLGKALIGAKKGQTVEIECPAGT